MTGWKPIPLLEAYPTDSELTTALALDIGPGGGEVMVAGGAFH